MPRYEGNTIIPRSKSRRSMLRRRGELNRRLKDRPYYTAIYLGYAHGKDGVSTPPQPPPRVSDHKEEQR